MPWPAGQAEVSARFATPVAGEPARDEVAIKLAFVAVTPGCDVSAVVQTQRRATIKALQDYTRGGCAAALPRRSRVDPAAW